MLFEKLGLFKEAKASLLEDLPGEHVVETTLLLLVNRAVDRGVDFLGLGDESETLEEDEDAELMMPEDAGLWNLTFVGDGDAVRSGVYGRYRASFALVLLLGIMLGKP